jgi:hypothetical protein
VFKTAIGLSPHLGNMPGASIPSNIKTMFFMQVYFYLSLVLAGVLGVVALAAPLALCLFWRSLAAEVGWQEC